MHEYFFADYRLLVDDAINSSDQMKYLAGFSQVMPATHTFTLNLGDEAQLGPLFAEAILHPIVCTTDGLIFTIRRIRGHSSRIWMTKWQGALASLC